MATYRAKKHKVKDVAWQSVVTGSTLTAVAGRGYPINTISNACTVTLPASASVGDTIVFADYARNWGTNAITIDSNGLNYQGDSDIFTIEYSTDGTVLRIVYVDATKGWIPTLDDAVGDAPSKTGLNGIFGFGYGAGTYYSTTNLVSDVGVVSTDVTGVGTARVYVGACQFGTGQGIFGFGWSPTTSYTAMTNLVSNAGVVATDTAGVGTSRRSVAACSYGGDKGIFGFGLPGWSIGNVSTTNLVSNAGVVSSDVTGVGTARRSPAACEYGGDKGIFGYGEIGPYLGSTFVSTSNLVSNAGVISSDVTGVGTARHILAACSYGGDKGIFGYGSGPVQYASMTNLVSNAGVVAADVTGVGTARSYLAACEYGGDKGIFGYGASALGHISMTNLVSNAGVVAADVTGVGTGKIYVGACSYN